jgi:sulfur carrier protein
MIQINGQAADSAGGMTVAAYLEQAQYNVHRVAVELNEIIIDKAEYETTIIKDGDVMEIVSFMGGGR